MSNIVIRPPWHLPGRMVTPEPAFHRRREFIKQLGLVGAGLLSTPWSARAADSAPASKKYPAKRNPDYNPGWRFTDEKIAGSYNNFYEFSLEKDAVKDLTGRFTTAPWPIEIKGLVEKPMTIDAAELVETMPLEERVYRFRCVEAWSMVVPWTGFPLSKLIEKVQPKAGAKFLRFETAHRPDQFPGVRRLPNYPWPYFEGLRLDEAMNPLTLVTTGAYGKPLAKQHGAPLRLIVPWKYGYKSIKSVVKIEFIDKQPKTFWETLGEEEYPFESNVNPKVPHPRWSQFSERVLDTGDRIRTLPYNGYGDLVAKLYAKS